MVWRNKGQHGLEDAAEEQLRGDGVEQRAARLRRREH
jgi:hypothetical protein